MMKDDNRYVWLDLIRGISALLVCAGHLRAAMFVDYSGLKTISITGKLFYFATGLGHQAVIVFFVLSGFFVGGSALKHRSEFHFGDYLVRRLSRLWMVLLPALIFTALFDLYLEAHHPSILAGAHYAILCSGPNQEYSSSLLTFFANLIFLQNIATPVFGSNGPLWTLSNLFWYYMLFPLLMIIAGYFEVGRNHRVIAFLALLLIAVLIAPAIVEGFIIWLFGVVVYVCYNKWTVRASKGFLLAAFLLFLLSLVDSKAKVIQGILPVSNDVVIGISLSIFLISLRDKDVPGRIRFLIYRVSSWLSKISYSLFLFHFPVVLIIFANYYSVEQVVFSFNGIVHYLFWLSFLIAGGWGFWWVFERNTNVVREFVVGHLTMRSSERAKDSRR